MTVLDSYDVRCMPRALRQAIATQTWWVAHREVAPTMFSDELARMIALLQQHPELGIRVRGLEIRRLLMPGTEHFIYYRVRSRARRIEVVAIWHAARQFGLPLPR